MNISFDDQFVIEAYQTTISLRNLKNKNVIAKYEGHQYNIRNLVFADNSSSYVFLSAANNECLLWNPKEIIKSQQSKLQEVS